MICPAKVTRKYDILVSDAVFMYYKIIPLKLISTDNAWRQEELPRMEGLYR